MLGDGGLWSWLSQSCKDSGYLTDGHRMHFGSFELNVAGDR